MMYVMYVMKVYDESVRAKSEQTEQIAKVVISVKYNFKIVGNESKLVM